MEGSLQAVPNCGRALVSRLVCFAGVILSTSGIISFLIFSVNQAVAPSLKDSMHLIKNLANNVRDSVT